MTQHEHINSRTHCTSCGKELTELEKMYGDLCTTCEDIQNAAADKEDTEPYPGEADESDGRHGWEDRPEPLQH